MQNFNNIKAPPNSIQSEQSVLGGLLIYNDAWDDISEIISEEDFYQQKHKIIFSAISLLLSHNEPADILTIKAQLAKTGDEEAIGGFSYLASIAETTPSVDNISSYAIHVRELSVYRQLITISNQLADDAYHPKNLKVDELIDKTESRIFAISEQITKNKSNINNIKDILKDVVNNVQLRAEKQGIFGVETGFIELDKLTNGLQNGDLIIIAGRPGMGKTALSMNIVENVAINANKTVVVFSLEMPTEQLVIRIISSYFNINMKRIQDGKMTAQEWDKFNQAVITLENSNIIIDDTPSITPTEIRARVRRIKRKYPDLSLVMVDYLQLMKVSNKGENRNQEISEISRSLKALAKEVDLPIIVLSQLNRNVESRPKAKKGRMPQMSDLRESGSIEQDADIIAFIYRDETYHDDSFSNPEEIGKADLKIAKHRNGSTGRIALSFIGEYAKFNNLSRELTEFEKEEINNSYNSNIDNFGEYAKSE